MYKKQQVIHATFASAGRSMRDTRTSPRRWKLARLQRKRASSMSAQWLVQFRLSKSCMAQRRSSNLFITVFIKITMCLLPSVTKWTPTANLVEKIPIVESELLPHLLISANPSRVNGLDDTFPYLVFINTCVHGSRERKKCSICTIMFCIYGKTRCSVLK